MRAYLWIHRDVEILQKYITAYTYSNRHLAKDRLHIQSQWTKIQEDMERLLKEVDQHVQGKTKIECLNSPKNNVPE